MKPKGKISPDEAARWLKKQLEKDQRDTPQHQAKGPIVKGPRAYVECTKCTRMLADPKRPGKIVGVPKQHARQHAADHKMGRVKKPSEAAR